MSSISGETLRLRTNTDVAGALHVPVITWAARNMPVSMPGRCPATVLYRATYMMQCGCGAPPLSQTPLATGCGVTGSTDIAHRAPGCRKGYSIIPLPTLGHSNPQVLDTQRPPVSAGSHPSGTLPAQRGATRPHPRTPPPLFFGTLSGHPQRPAWWRAQYPLPAAARPLAVFTAMGRSLPHNWPLHGIRHCAFPTCMAPGGVGVAAYRPSRTE